VHFALCHKAYKRSINELSLKINKMFQLSLNAYDQFFEIVLVGVVRSLAKA
jgi:hypothetical protein